MSEFDFPQNWIIRTGNASKHKLADVERLKNMTRSDVMRWIRERGLVSYKIEEE